MSTLRERTQRGTEGDTEAHREEEREKERMSLSSSVKLGFSLCPSV
jgi:hypothetical protein